MNKLTAHKFKPFAFIGSTASFLTKDYAGYEAAKNTSETLKPATRIFQIYPPLNGKTLGRLDDLLKEV